MVYCMDYLANNLDWLQEKLEVLQAGKLHGAANMLPSQARLLSRQGIEAGSCLALSTQRR